MTFSSRSGRRLVAPTRRSLLLTSLAVFGAATLGSAAPFRTVAQPRPPRPSGYGPLVPDPAGVLDLPAGFEYKVLLSQGDQLTDGTPRPGRADGMAAFNGPAGTVVLCTNHELMYVGSTGFPVPSVAGHYDAQAVGGTSMLLVDGNLDVQQAWISSSGTLRNCAGGSTPWGTWLTCEESEDAPGNQGVPATQSHGWTFEVDPMAPLNGGPPRQIRLDALGRFFKEAVVVEPSTRTAYMTEDRTDGLFYRFQPAPGSLPDDFGAYSTAAGTLAALAIPGLPSGNDAEVGIDYTPVWLRVPDPSGARVPVRGQTYEGEPTRFDRGEGMAWSAGEEAVYFDATGGGTSPHVGQIWRYHPASNTLRLLYQSTDADVLEMPDNLLMLPWGDLVICEDGSLGSEYLRVLTPESQMVDLARNALSDSEFAGASFSVELETLFVNFQADSMTIAIRGPWSSLER